MKKNLSARLLAAGAVGVLLASGATSAVAADAPYVKKNPVLTVTAATGTAPNATPTAFSCTTGRWANVPSGQTYKIQVLRDSSKVVQTVAVPFGSAPTYTIPAGNAGHTYKCVVTVQGQKGFTQAITASPGGGNAASGVATPADPQLTAPSKVAGTDVTVSNAVSGGVVTLTCNEGSWDPAAPATVDAKNYWTYRWTRNGSQIATGTPAVPASGKTYVVVGDDLGSKIGCVVSQTRNGYTSGGVASANTFDAPGTPPGGGAGTPGPSITGDNPAITKTGSMGSDADGTDGEGLQCNAGDWSNPTGVSGALTYSFKWLLNSDSNNPLKDSTAFSGTTTDTFVINKALQGVDTADKITCVVTVKSINGGTNSAVTNPVEVQ